jgi:hypothetical protein
VTVSKDGIVRRAEVMYQNASESQPRYTDRAARSLIKLFHIDDQHWQADMAEVERLVNDLKKVEANDDVAVYKMTHTGDGLRYRLDRLQATSHDTIQRKKGVQHTVGARTARNKMRSCEKCCCAAHCLLATHGPKIAINVPIKVDASQDVFANMLDRSWMSMDEFKEYMMDSYVKQSEEFMGLLSSVNTDLDGVSLDTINLCPSSDNFMA